MSEDETLKPSHTRAAAADTPLAPEPLALETPVQTLGVANTGAGVTDVQTYIGRQLRAVFDDVAKQPVPQRFLDLMQQLEDRTAGR